MSDISDMVIFKKGTCSSCSSCNALEISQKFIKLKSHETGILIFNFSVSEEDILKVKDFFLALTNSEQIKVDIGETGDINCYYKGLSPIIERTDEAGHKYFFVSATLQELITEIPEDDASNNNSCSCSL